MAQPYRSFVKNIFEKQRYPDLRKNVNAEPEMPYDMAGWTLTARHGGERRADRRAAAGRARTGQGG